MNPKVNIKKETTNIRLEINEIETKKTLEKIKETRTLFFTFSVLHSHLSRLQSKKICEFLRYFCHIHSLQKNLLLLCSLLLLLLNYCDHNKYSWSVYYMTNTHKLYKLPHLVFITTYY